MFVLRLGSTYSTFTHSENMPPAVKRTRITGDSFCSLEEKEKSHSENAIEPEPEIVDVGLDWRDTCDGICSKNSYALKNKVLSDVKFVVGQKQVEFHCHRLILALGSPVFEAMFYGTLADTSDTVTVSDVEPEGFQHLVSFMYSDKFGFNTDAAAFQTYFAADKYCVLELKRRCEKYLCHRKLSPDNVWTFLEYSLLLNSSDIKTRCLYILKQDTKSSLEHFSFLELSPRAIETLLSAEDLDIDEVELINYVIRWSEHHTEGKEVESFRMTLTPLLQHVRFSTLRAHEFVALRKNTRLSEVLNDQDALAILEHIINPKDCALPQWCCSKKQRKKKCMKEEMSEKTKLTQILFSSGHPARTVKRSVGENRYSKSKRQRSRSSTSSLSSSVETIGSSDGSDT